MKWIRELMRVVLEVLDVKCGGLVVGRDAEAVCVVHLLYEPNICGGEEGGFISCWQWQWQWQCVSLHVSLWVRVVACWC